MTETAIEKLNETYTEFLTDMLPKDEESCIVVDAKIEQDLQGLPEELLYMWRQHGICSYGHGLWWHVNPRDFDEVLEEWLIDTPYWDPKNNRYHVIGRSAFGKLRLWGEQTGRNLEIDPIWGMISHTESNEKYIAKGETWRPVNTFIGGGSNATFCDVTDNNDKFLFARALQKFGPLQYNEMYTFAPPPFIDDKLSIRKMHKEDLFVQMSILRQMIEEPDIIDFEAWYKQTGH